MRRTKLFLKPLLIAALATPLLPSITHAGLFDKVMNNGAIGITPSPSDISKKTLGDVSFEVTPLKKTYNPRYASRDLVNWKITITNNCSRVYRTKDAARGVWVADKPLDWKTELKNQVYGQMGESFQEYTEINDLQVIPGQSEVFLKAFIRAGKHLKYAYPKTIKIAFYDLPICKGGKILDEVGTLEWNFIINPKPYED